MGDNLFHQVQITFMMSMFILAADGFDIIMAFFRNDYIEFLEQCFIIFLMEDSVFFFSKLWDKVL